MKAVGTRATSGRSQSKNTLYLAIPCLLLLASRSLASRLVGGFAIVSIAVRWIEFHYFPDISVNLQFRTENRIDALMWGAMLALIGSTDAGRTLLRRLLKPALNGAVALGVFLALFAIEDTSIRRTIVALALPALIASTVLNPTALLSRALELPALRWIGRLSYSLYIWHMLFFLLPTPADMPALQSFPINLVATFACAGASYYLIERSTVRFSHRITVPRPVALASVPGYSCTSMICNRNAIQ